VPPASYLFACRGLFYRGMKMLEGLNQTLSKLRVEEVELSPYGVTRFQSRSTGTGDVSVHANYTATSDKSFCFCDLG